MRGCCKLAADPGPNGHPGDQAVTFSENPFDAEGLLRHAAGVAVIRTVVRDASLHSFDKVDAKVEQDGAEFVVREYLDGETLAARLDRRALPLDLAMRYAMEITDALARQAPAVQLETLQPISYVQPFPAIVGGFRPWGARFCTSGVWSRSRSS